MIGLEVYLFGSFASGTPTPKSDVDLLIVTSEELSEGLSAYFLSVSVPVDIHVMTESSFRQREKTEKGVVGEVLRRGFRLV